MLIYKARLVTQRPLSHWLRSTNSQRYSICFPSGRPDSHDNKRASVLSKCPDEGHTMPYRPG